MIIKSLRLGNIRSYIDEKIDFPLGSLLLSGDVGSGKSTILLAIDYALFGIRRGELSGGDLLRHGKNSGFVELDLMIGDNDVKIRRELKRDRTTVKDSCALGINGTTEEFTSSEMKARVLELLGYPKDLLKRNIPIFRYTVYTPQEEMKHILLHAEDRLDTLRKIFNIDKYGRIKENSRMMITELRAMKRELESYTRDLEEKIRDRNEKSKSENDITTELTSVNGRLDSINKRLEEKRNDIEKIKSEIEELNRINGELIHKETDMGSRERRRLKISADMTDINSRMEKMGKDLENYKITEKPPADENEIKNSISALENEKYSLVSKTAIIDEDVKKLSEIFKNGICKTCGQKVSDPKAFENNMNEKASSLSALKLHIEGVTNEIKRLRNVQIETNKYMMEAEKKKNLEYNIAALATNKSSLEEENRTLVDDITNLKSDIDLIKTKIDRLAGVRERYDVLDKESHDIQQERFNEVRIKSRLDQQLDDTKKLIVSLTKEIDEKTNGREKTSKLNEFVAWIDVQFVNLVESIEKNVMLTIQQEFNNLFREWFSMIMQDEILTVKIDDNFMPIIEQNGYETEYQNLSGGEKTAVALAYRLALNRVINTLIETIKTKDLLILDEPMDGFSSDQLDRIKDVISELNMKQIIIVSHDPKVDTFVDNVIKLYKDQHISKIMI
ncbi:MAG: AAA family ATPase [Candidatus Aenigmatarchaeota archaeon]